MPPLPACQPSVLINLYALNSCGENASWSVLYTKLQTQPQLYMYTTMGIVFRKVLKYTNEGMSVYMTLKV